MSPGKFSEINYWPAYVDALINVVLNLLFLVGVFTIGLVTLNGQALFTEQKATQLKLDSLLSAQSDRERQKLTEQLLRTLPPPPDTHNRFAIVDALNELSGGGIKEIRLNSESNTFKKDTSAAVSAQKTKTQQTVDELITSLALDGDLTRIEFELNQYSLAADWVWPKPLDPSSDKAWALYAIADATNPRLAREAFARLVSVRNELIKAGAKTSQIQLQVKPPPELATVLPKIERTVFVIERTL
jgi:hypothetical protein